MADIKDIAYLLKLSQTDPKGFDKLLAKNPEMWDNLIALDRRMKLAELARTDTYEGAAAWHEMKHAHPPPAHVKRWLKKLYHANDEGQGILFFGFRGSWKTVSFTTEFERQIGLHPEKSNLLIAASGPKADDLTLNMASTIEKHPAWKFVFPNVIPGDKWGAEGYSVVDKSVSSDEWAKLKSATLDPTLVGAGYDSHLLNGRHPNGILYVDDVHDLKNSSSMLQRKRVVDTFTTTLLKIILRGGGKLITRMWCVGTPWDYDDANYYLKNTGEFFFDELSAMKRAEEGAKNAVYCDGVSKSGVLYGDIVGWWIPQTEHYGIEEFKADRAILGKSVFWQMIMLDLAMSSTGRLIYYEYPKDEIRYDLYTIGGADPTTFTASPEGNRNSHFALAYLSKLPTGGAVVVDGVLEQCSQLAAENHILAAQGLFQNWAYTAVEDVSVGKVFLQTLQRNPKIRAIPSGLKGITDGRITSKHDRVKSVHKWFENGTVRISNADTPFLNALRRGLDKFFDLDAKDPAFDAWDAVFHAMKNMPDVLQEYEAEIPYKRERVPHPLDGIGNHIGYGNG